ncbi:MAG: MotA/TolQ/ExbB proton channel family protein [Candidatus Eisenbacteria bacterium]|uniref:MotA/TolQ/ExbB proton channel family protein n=1 Tax=Eiseniibacteriota bacterium TaxID=2212470 RepID=A0A948RSX3_UNCEI|nr:MotA/TolQ/ExbB proton channel family protein [Candidatus Eisenbacteria bacterium]MBU1949337.1 MotA/TolQ/ExbB proton channel family protein [Candidatus Eisenbacteria bacterium]MBU2690410.1 MotA/TolQ/ExbB proton channel family protein [Candidatus Eisenbacteria bacterium]
MFEFLQKAGPLIYPLALCSIVATTIAIERILALRRSRVLPREIIEVVEAVRPNRELDLAIEVCRRNPGVFSDVILVGLEYAHEPWEIMRDMLVDMGRQKTAVLERHLVWLQTIAQAAPLLGLLGTVLGMIKMFASISLSGLGDPQALSGGISEAIVTTAIGLGIGIPSLITYNVLASKSETLVAEIEAYAGHLVAQLRLNHPASPAAASMTSSATSSREVDR